MAQDKLPRCAETLNSELSRPALEALLDQILRERPASPYLEIGTAAGGALRDMMLCFEDTEVPQMVVIDPMTYFPDQIGTVRRNISRHGLDLQKVILRIETSNQAFARADKAHEEYGLILVDGSTRLTDIMKDLRWTRLLRVGGLVCINNVDDQHKGNRLAVSRFLRKYPEYECVRREGSLIILRKTTQPKKPEIGAADQLFARLRGLLLKR